MLREKSFLALLFAALVPGCRSRAPSAEIVSEAPPIVSAPGSAPLPAAAAASSSASLPDTAAPRPPVPAPARSTIASRTSYVSHSDCAITETAEVQCWSNDAPPAPVPGLRGVDSLAANDDFTCALTKGGAVRCWGGGPFESGRDGGPAGAPADRPQRVRGLPDDVEAISAGGWSFCARRRGGVLRCLTKSYDGWPTTWVARPGARAVARGGSLDCWIHPDGPVTCKGGEAPVVATLPGKHTALAISGWGVHGTGAEVVSVVEGGRLRWSSGPHQFGQIAKQVVPLPRPVVQLAAGVHHLCALLDDGSIHCWDGRPNIEFRNPEVQSMPDRAVEITAGDRHACARLESGKVACFGGGYTAGGAAAPKVILGG